MSSDAAGAGQSSPPPSRRRRSAVRTTRTERTTQILRATADVVGEFGITESRISDIAERAGMSAGHVLYYYPTKDDLLLATLEAMEAGELDPPAKRSRTRPGTPLQQLRTHLIRNAPTGPADVRYLLLLSVWERAARDERVRKVVDGLSRRWVDHIANLLQQAVEIGEISCPDVQLAAQRISSLHDGLSLAVTAATSFITPERMNEILDDELARLAR